MCHCVSNDRDTVTQQESVCDGRDLDKSSTVYNNLRVCDILQWDQDCEPFESEFISSERNPGMGAGLLPD